MSEQLSGGMAGLPFVTDLITLLGNSWVNNNGGDKPQFFKSWEFKEAGLGDGDYSVVIVSLDSEDPKIFSMLQNNGGNPLMSNYDWLHDVSATIDIRTSRSESRVLEMTNEIIRILKTNVVPIINFNQYIRLLPTAVTSMNEEYRGLYRYIVDVDCLRFNP